MSVAGVEIGMWGFFLLFFVLGPAMGWGWRTGHRSRRRWYGEDRPGRQRGPALTDELLHRDLMIEQLEARVAELENRVDFAERLLASGGRADISPAFGPRSPDPASP